jgi:hypothetical protein
MNGMRRMLMTAAKEMGKRKRNKGKKGDRDKEENLE